MKKKKLAIAAGIGALSTASYLTYRKVAEQIFNRIFAKKEEGYSGDQRYLEWLNDSYTTQVRITSFDGLKLNAYHVRNHQSNDYIILVHGIGSDKSSMYPRAYEFDKLGYDLLLIDQRASGDSAGRYHTYGLKEAIDILQWVNYLTGKYPEARITLYGVSMGAVSVMMTCAGKLPDNVCCIVEDCGYSSLKEELAHVIKKDYGVRYPGLVLKLVGNMMEDRLGFSYEDVNIKEHLNDNEVPIMFIHGMEDELVPFEMAKRLYNHNKGTKKFYPVSGAGHAAAADDPQYYANIDAFIKQSAAGDNNCQ